MACAGTFERLGAQRQTEGRRQPEARRNPLPRGVPPRSTPRVSPRPIGPLPEHSVSRNPPALLRPLATGSPPLHVATGRERWCAGRSCAWCERRVTGRTLSRARRAQVQLAATRIALHTHKLWRRRRTRSSSPDMKRGAPCGGTAFVALWCCARGADGAVEATVDVAYTCSLRETAHCARPPSAPSGIRRSRESPPTHSLL